MSLSRHLLASSSFLKLLLYVEVTKQEGKAPKAELATVKWGWSLPSEQCSNWHFHFNQVGTTKSQQGLDVQASIQQDPLPTGNLTWRPLRGVHNQCRTALLWTPSITSYPALNTIISILKSWPLHLIADAPFDKFWQVYPDTGKNENRKKTPNTNMSINVLTVNLYFRFCGWKEDLTDKNCLVGPREINNSDKNSEKSRRKTQQKAERERDSVNIWYQKIAHKI